MKVINETGRITYRILMCIIKDQMTEEQKDMDVTAASPLYDHIYTDGSCGPKCGDYGGLALNLVVPDKDGLDQLGLDDNHPVFIGLETEE